MAETIHRRGTHSPPRTRATWGAAGGVRGKADGGGGVGEAATKAAEYPAEDFRNQRFKLVPRIVDGPWVVKSTVPAKPALLGQKLTQRYFRGECYVETCIHVGSSMVANRITGLCRGFSTQIEVDIGITLEGRSEDELPEKMIGAARMSYTSMDIGDNIDESDGE